MSDTKTNPEVLYFGWIANYGHGLRKRQDTGRHYYDLGHTPWGYNIDGGLILKSKTGYQDGKIHFLQKDGWSVISFWDNSGDARPNSNTAFLVHALVSQDELLALASEQWPEVFKRPGFPIK